MENLFQMKLYIYVIRRKIMQRDVEMWENYVFFFEKGLKNYVKGQEVSNRKYNRRNQKK
ncbi:hypothetical protein YC2023_098075 [Brassica napus]